MNVSPQDILGMAAFAQAQDAHPPDVVGLNVYEGPNGVDTLEALGQIRTLRALQQRVGAIVIAPGSMTEQLSVDIALFNQEAYRGGILPEDDARRVEAGARKRWRKMQARASRRRKD